MNYVPCKKRRKFGVVLKWKEGVRNIMRVTAIEEEEWRGRKMYVM